MRIQPLAQGQLLRALFLSGLGLLVAAIVSMLDVAQTASATSDYAESLSQPCVSCHVTSTAPTLNARGLSFEAVPTHRSDPAGAWNIAVQANPLQGRAMDSSWVLPVALAAIAGAAAFALSRRRRVS
jgi:hypothetical protein